MGKSQFKCFSATSTDTKTENSSSSKNKKKQKKKLTKAFSVLSRIFGSI